MAERQKVRVLFEFDRKDYDNCLFLLGMTDKDSEEIEKTWDVMLSEDVVLKSDTFKSLGIDPRDMLAMFVTAAIVKVEDKVKSK